MTLIIDNPAVEQVLKPGEVVAALEYAARELATGGAVNAPPYRVFTPRKPSDYGPDFPAGASPVHHAFTSLTGAIAGLNVTADRIDSDIITLMSSAKDASSSGAFPARPTGASAA